jgi:hypothetical protein
MNERTFEQIFQQAALCGPENVLLTDPEVAIVVTGGAKPVPKQTIVACRYRGKIPPIAMRGSDRAGLTRLSDVLALNAKKRKAG